MAIKKKLLTSAVALGTAAVMALGGTFAWQSINQRALNESADIVNPGGRLHDDFDGTDKNVYVENFADDDIFARIRLEEFFEIVLNAGTPGEKSIPMIGTKAPRLDDGDQPMMTENGNPIYDYEYVTFTDYQPGFSTEAGIVDGTSWWSWSTGGDTVFMPTFNKNKDSLKADINGEYKFDTGVITDKDIEGGQYTTMVTYEEDETMDAHAIYDIDSNDLDEIAQEDLAALIEGGTLPEEYAGNVKLLDETHTAKATPAGSLISMADWLEAVTEFGYVEGYDTCWVYDTDGWVYWSAPIRSGEATGLLLDGIELNQVMDDSWYYAINVVAQFVTANDVGKGDSTGFYAVEDEKPSADAETLLETIGVEIDESNSEPGTDVPVDDDTVIADHKLTMSVGTGAYAVSVPDTRSNTVKLRGFFGDIPTGETELYTANWNTYFDESDYSYDESTGILTVLLQDGDERLNATGTRLTVAVGGVCGDIVWADDGELTLTKENIDGTMAPLNTGVKVYDAEGNPVTALKRVAWTVGDGPMVENEDYTFDNSTVTIINPEFAGRPIAIVGESDGAEVEGEEENEPMAVLYVAPAASSGSTEPEPENYDLTVTPEKSRLAKDRDSSLNFKVLLDGQTLPDATKIRLIPCGSDGTSKGQVYPTQVGSSDIYSMGANWFFNDEDIGDVKAGCKGFYTSLEQPNGNQVLSEIANLYFYEYTVTLTENGDQAAAQTMAKSDDRTTKSLHFLIDDHDKLLDSSTDTSKANFCNTVLAVSRLDTDSGIETAVTGDDLQAGLPDATGYSWYSAELDGGRLSISYAKLTGDVAASYTGSDTLIFRMTRGDKTYSAKVNFTE